MGNTTAMHPIRLALLTLAPLAPGHFADAHPAPPRAHGEQGEARRDLRAGNVHALRDIERQILPSMADMEYLGPEYDPDAMAYRLKFIRDGRVMFVDVDARTGLVRGRSR